MQINQKNISTRSNTISRMRVPYGYREVNVDRSASELLELVGKYRGKLAITPTEADLDEPSAEVIASVRRIAKTEQQMHEKRTFMIDMMCEFGRGCGIDMTVRENFNFFDHIGVFLIHKNLLGKKLRGDGSEEMCYNGLIGVEEVPKALKGICQDDEDRKKLVFDAVMIVAHACEYDGASAMKTHEEMADVLKQLQTMYGPPKTEIELEKIFEYYEPKLKETITEAAAELQRQEAAAQAKAEAAEKAQIAEEKAQIAEEKRLERNRRRREARARKKAAAQQAAKAANQTTTSTALKVSGGQRKVDLTGFTATQTGLTPQQVVKKLVKKHGEVRNVYDANGKIIPNRLVAVGTVPAIESWNKKNMGSGFTKRIYEVITTVNLRWQNARLKELLVAEPTLKDIVAFCDAQDAELVSRSIRKEFYSQTSNDIWWFFTGQLAKFNNSNFIGDPKKYKKLGPCLPEQADLDRNADFAYWFFNSGSLYRSHADDGGNDGAFVVQAQW